MEWVPSELDFEIQSEADLKEFSFDLIEPNSLLKRNGATIVMIGKRGCGKSTLVKTLLYNKRNVVSLGIAMSGSENANNFYSSFFPPLFVYDEYKEEILAQLRQRQILAIKNVQDSQKFAVLILDDCSYDKSIFNRPLQQELFKNGRHYNLLYIMCIQYGMDIPPSIKNNIDGVFLFRDTNLDSLKKIYSNFCGVFFSFDKFKEIMSKYTENFGCIFIKLNSQSNNWQDCVYKVKIDPCPQDFKFGNESVWTYNDFFLKKNCVDE